jgi:outer membrane protein OmpA-like peptidoglycan-associated protein
VKISGGQTVGILVAGGLLGALGCAHSFPPPRELVEARAAYARAEKGTAAQLAPARLKLARQALNSAELSYGGAPESEVRDRAYIAVRRAEAAEAEAEADVARQRRERALRELASLSGVHAEKARAELAAAGVQIDQANQQAMSERQRADEESRRAQEANTNLASERQARAQAEAQARQAMAELERMANVKRESRGLVITLSGQVLFVTDQATLLPAARTSLDSVVAALKGVTPETGKVVIEGHTDSTGARGYNLELSQKRAQAVRDYLVSHGVAGDLLTTQGVGPDRPVANNRSPEGRANNRRVEIVIPSGAALAQQAPAAADAAAPAQGTVGRFRVGGSGTPSTPPGVPSTSTTSPGTTSVPSPGTTSGLPPTGTTPGTATSSSSASSGTTPRPSSSSATTPSVPPSPSTVTPPPNSTVPGTTAPSTTPPTTTSPSGTSPSRTTPPPSPGTVTPPPTPGTSTPPPAPGTSTTPPSSTSPR